MECGLTAHLSAADEDHGIAQLLLVAQGLDGHLGLLNTGHRQDQRLCTDGHQHCIVARHGLRNCLGAKLYRNGALVHLTDQPVHVVLHRVLEGEVARIVEHAAQTIRLLKQRHLMATVCGHAGGLHARRAAADDGHLLTCAGGLHQLLEAGLQSGGGVHGTLEVVAVHRGVVAAHALDAGGHVLGLALDALVDQLGICNEAPGHGHKVGLAVLDDLLGRLQRINGAQRHNGHMELAGLLKCLCHTDIGHRRPEAAGMHPCHPLGIVHARRHLKDIQMILNLLADADALFQINAALFKLGAGDTDFDQQLLPYPGTDGIEDLNEIPAAVLRGAAVFIGALVGQGGQELCQGN